MNFILMLILRSENTAPALEQKDYLLFKDTNEEVVHQIDGILAVIDIRVGLRRVLSSVFQKDISASWMFADELSHIVHFLLDHDPGISFCVVLLNLVPLVFSSSGRCAWL